MGYNNVGLLVYCRLGHEIKGEFIYKFKAYSTKA